MSFYFLYSHSFLQTKPPTRLSSPEWAKYSGSSEGTIFATMIGLMESGVSVEWGSEWPSGKIVIAHPDALRFVPRKKKFHNFLVCWQQDRLRCEFAHVHIVMNKTLEKPESLPLYERLLMPGLNICLHYIPEPFLIPRSENRGSRFERVVYYGALKNLHPEFQTEDWRRELASMGLTFYISCEEDKRNDYSQADCVLALRPPRPDTKLKSPHKLWNAWRAGVPAILGPEPGFRDYRVSDLDYIEISNPKEAIVALRRLCGDTSLRLAMVENGKKRSAECSPEFLITQWREFFHGTLLELAADWFGSPLHKRLLFICARSVRTVLRNARELQQRLGKEFL